MVQEMISEQESSDGEGKSLTKVVMAIRRGQRRRQSTKTNK